MNKFCKALIPVVFMSVTAALFSQNQGNTSIAMLNYVATQTRLINSTRDNRLMLEGIYNKLINNTNPGIVDETTQDYLEELLGNIESFRIITLQRERLQYILENQQSNAITQAMPNPMYLLVMLQGQNIGASVVNAVVNPKRAVLRAVAAVTAMTIDSVFKYTNAKNTAELEFLQENWELDDKQSATLHNLRVQAFSYMIDVARTNNLGLNDTLNEESIDKFVNYTLDENLQRRRQGLEDNRAIYEKYAPYWLELANVYYELEMYNECMGSIAQYESVKAPIFRKDFDLAAIMPKAVIAASQVYNETDTRYMQTVQDYLKKLIDNTNDSDWALRYFAAQAYLNLASINNRQENLQSAYNLLVTNVTYLSRQQEQDLLLYSNPVNETIEKALTNDQKKKEENMIKKLKEARKTELPPLNSALAVNYQVLNPIMTELNTSQAEYRRIQGIMDKAFLIPTLRHVYFNEAYAFDINNFKLERSIGIGNVINTGVSIFSGSSNWNQITLTLPAVYVTSESVIEITLQSDASYTLPNVEYQISSVDRKKSTEIAQFMASLKIPLGSTLVIRKDRAYAFNVKITTNEETTILDFSCPPGATEFVLTGIR